MNNNNVLFWEKKNDWVCINLPYGYPSRLLKNWTAAVRLNLALDSSDKGKIATLNPAF